MKCEVPRAKCGGSEFRAESRFRARKRAKSGGIFRAGKRAKSGGRFRAKGDLERREI